MRAGRDPTVSVALVERLTTWDRLRRVNPFVLDGLLAVAVFIGSFLAGSSIHLSQGRGLGPGIGFDIGSGSVAFSAGWGALLLIGAACAPLVWRRRAPVATLCVTAIAVLAYQFGGFPDGLVAIALMVASYTAAAHRERGPALAAAVMIALASGFAMALLGSTRPRGRVEILSIVLVTAGLPLLFGRIAFNRRRRLERERDRATRDAVADERARIAREMHDAVAHAMTVMVVQAGGARVVIDRDPEEAVAALRRIEDTGRAGLGEMRRLIGVLETDGEAVREPQPGLDRMHELLETMRATGLPVEATVEGRPRELPPGVDLIAYRVMQEALTNTLKHAGDAHARVLLRYGDEALELEVADDGRGPSSEEDGSPGHGLIGMRERIALFGGSLETGSRPGGGFVVRARIPMADTA
jgi:signal transduction histidine kinase